MNAPSSTRPYSRGKRAMFMVVLLAFAALVALVLAEVVLRLVPIPGIAYHSFYYDPVTGGKNYPNTTLMFRGDDGVTIRRHANAWGFPDVDHEMTPAPGTLRIGFFGDSYTEAMQVTLEQTFFRIVENDLNARVSEFAGATNRRGDAVTRVETIAFGMSGRSTLQSYQECLNWMEPLDLDYVVYVFVENDVADHFARLKGSDAVPYPVFSADTFTVDLSFNDRYGYKTSWWHRAQQRLKSNSLVVSTIEGRLKLLKRHGVKRTVAEADREGLAGGGGAPMAPSAWPPDMLPQGWDMVERIVSRWKRDVSAQGRTFMILRVPRGETVIDQPLDGQDSWAPRLHEFCARAGIPLVDPTPYFLPHVREGRKIYHHHFTPTGHRAFAEAFVGYVVARECAHHP